MLLIPSRGIFKWVTLTKQVADEMGDLTKQVADEMGDLTKQVADEMEEIISNYNFTLEQKSFLHSSLIARGYEDVAMLFHIPDIDPVHNTIR